MKSLLHDLRFSVRQLVKRPGFSFIAVSVLALGIGAATAIFSVLDTLVIRALPYSDPERVVTIWENNRESGFERDDVAPANYVSWYEQAESFSALAALDPYSLDLTGSERPEVIFAVRVSEEFFEALDTGMLHGRVFLPEDFEDGLVVVIGEGLWERRFGRDPNLVGQTIELDGDPYQVIGILPRRFNPHLHPTVAEREAWVPLVLQGWERNVRGSRWWNVIAKLAPGVTTEQAQAEMDAISGRLAQDYPETNAGIRANVVPLREHLVSNARTALYVLQGAVLFLLLVACANVASLMMARGAERHGEFALRAALGAGRGTLIRQLLTESVLIALVGGLGGVLLAFLAVDLIAAIAPAQIPRIDEVAVDGRVLGFALGVAGLTAFVFGLIPSLHFSRPDLQAAIKEHRGARSSQERVRIRSGMVVAEVALSLILVVGAGLMARSFASLLGVDPGFDGEDVAVAQVFRYVDDETPAERTRFFSQALDAMRALPGVRSAGAVSAFPLIEANISIQQSFQVVGRSVARPEDRPNAFLARTTADYFETMSIPLLEGRTFTTEDGADGVPVAVVTRGLARRHWRDGSPLGDRVYIGDGDGDSSREGDGRTAWEVVGVVGEVRHDGLDQEARPELFIPHAQSPDGSMTFVARTEGDPAAYLDPMQEIIWSLDPNQAIYRTATVSELVSKSVAGERFNLWLLGVFAGLALLLAAVGIYGVVSYTTRAATHEIGVRMALGAGRRDVLRQVMLKGLRLTGIGIALGLVGALGLTRILASLLFGIGPRDPLTFLGVASILGLVALAATYLPARRAAQVDPLVTLRVE